MMTLSLLERMAISGTGRTGVEGRVAAGSRLILYPNHLSFSGLVHIPKDKATDGIYYLGYGPSEPGPFRMGDMVSLSYHLIKIVSLAREIHVYCLSRRQDQAFAMAAGVIGSLGGVPVTLHDYRFSSGRGEKEPSRLYALCRRVELGDVTAFEAMNPGAPASSCRIEAVDRSAYGALKKKQAVPRVIAYGDFEDGRIVSLVYRVHELVKRKYPRTEFFLTSFSAGQSLDPADMSLRVSSPQTEKELWGLFSEADVVMLLSPGGVNRMFLARALAAGYPVIANGLDYSAADPGGRRIVTIPRDSYSSLADAVISLVDDDAYYRSFAGT